MNFTETKTVKTEFEISIEREIGKGMEGAAATAAGQYNPRTVEEVFKDFKGRRGGLVKALTTGKCELKFLYLFILSLLPLFDGIVQS